MALGALYNGMAHKSDWAQRRRDRQQDAIYQEKIAEMKEAEVDQMMKNEAAVTDYLSQFEDTGVLEKDQERMNAEFKKQKAELISSMAKYGGDINKWMKVGGLKELSKFKDNFQNTEVYKQSMSTKEAMNSLRDGLAKGMHIPSVMVKINDGDKITTKRMTTADALKAYDAGEIHGIVNNSVRPEPKIKFNLEELLTKGYGSAGENVTRDHVFQYAIDKGASKDYATELANNYQEMVNKNIDNGNVEGAGWRFGPSKGDLYEDSLLEYNNKLNQQYVSQLQKDEQNLIAAGRFSNSLSGSTRGSVSSGGGRSSSTGGTGYSGQGGKDAYINIIGTKINRYMTNTQVSPGFDSQGHGILSAKESDILMNQIGAYKVRAGEGDDNVTPDYALKPGTQIMYQSDRNSPNVSDQESVTIPRNATIVDTAGIYKFIDDSGVERPYMAVVLYEDDYNNNKTDNSVDYKTTHGFAYIPLDQVMNEGSYLSMSKETGIRNKDNNTYFEQTDAPRDMQEKYMNLLFDYQKNYPPDEAARRANEDMQRIYSYTMPSGSQQFTNQMVENAYDRSN